MNKLDASTFYEGFNRLESGKFWGQVLSSLSFFFPFVPWVVCFVEEAAAIKVYDINA